MKREPLVLMLLLLATVLLAATVARGLGPTPTPSASGTVSPEEYSLLVIVKAPTELVPGGKPQVYQCLNVKVIVEPGREGSLTINMTGDTSPGNVERALLCLKANLGPAPASWSPQPRASGTVTYYSRPLGTAGGPGATFTGSPMPSPTPGGEAAHALAGPASSNSSRLAIALGAGLVAGVAAYIIMARW